jgi:hypothetical protein
MKSNHTTKLSMRSIHASFLIWVIAIAGTIGFFSAPAHADWPAVQISDLPFDCIRSCLYDGQIGFNRRDGSRGLWFWDGTFTGGSPSDPVQIHSTGHWASLYEGNIAFESSDHTYYWTGGTTFQSIGSGFSEWPSLYDGKIAFNTIGGCYDVVLWDGSNYITVAATSLCERTPCLYGDQIAYFAGENVQGEFDIYLWQDGVTHRITNTPGKNESQVRLHKGQLAWDCDFDGDYEIVYQSDPFDPTTRIQLTDNEYDDQEPSVWNGTVAWSGWDGSDWEIFYWDGSTVHQVTDNDIDDEYASLHGNQLAYSSKVNGYHQIMLTQIPEPTVSLLVGVSILGILRRRSLRKN